MSIAASNKNSLTGQPYSKAYHRLRAVRDSLPIATAKERVQKCVRRYQVTLLVGETGSGKSTQVPAFLLELGPRGRIACTQPRRVAATSLAERVAQELDVVLGEEVGYSIRFEDVSSESTRIKYLTDGMLLREAMCDPLLTQYDVVVLDEAHERTVASDLLCGIVKRALEKRPELRVVVMSATLEQQTFQNFFPTAPLITVGGRKHGVDVFYSANPEANYVEAAIRTAVQIHLCEPEGDVLIFLCGEEEIETAVERISLDIPAVAAQIRAGEKTMPFEVLPLYSALLPSQQRRVFDRLPDGTRKIVVATNIAETSLTIDGIVYVVDSGFSKQQVYNPKLQMESLLVTPISQASANQRAGRAGRTRHGVCFRLYTRASFDALLPSSYPEMLRGDLASVVLQLKVMGVDDFVHFEFVEPPSPESLMHALELLHALGALTDDGDLTPRGRVFAELPIEPEVGAFLVEATLAGCRDDAAKLAALLTSPSPFRAGRPGRERQTATRAHAALAHPSGDHVTLLRAMEGYLEAGPKGRDFAHEYYLNDRVLAHAKSVYRQLRSAIARLEPLPEEGSHKRVMPNPPPPTGDPDVDFEAQRRWKELVLRKALLCGYVGHVAMALPSKGQYITLARGVKALLHPSTLLDRRPQFVVYTDFILTSSTYLRTVTALADEWLMEVAPDTFDPSKFEGLTQHTLASIRKRWAMRVKGAVAAAESASDDE